MGTFLMILSSHHLKEINQRSKISKEKYRKSMKIMNRALHVNIKGKKDLLEKTNKLINVNFNIYFTYFKI